MLITTRSGFAVAVLYALVFSLSGPLAFGQCSEYKLLVPDALSKGQSISIRSFNLLPWSYPENRQFGEEQGRSLQQNFARNLSSALQSLGYSTSEEATTDLAIGGSTTGVTDTADGVKVTVSAFMRRSSDGQEVLRISECATTIKINEGRLGSNILRNFPGILDGFFANIAKDMAQTIALAGKSAAKSPPSGSQKLPPPTAGSAPVPSNAEPSAGPPESVEALIIAARTETDKSSRTAAIKALGNMEIKKPKEIQSVIDLLSVVLKKDSLVSGNLYDTSEHEAAMAVLVKMKEPRALDAVVNALKHQDWLVRAQAAMALGTTSDPRAIEPLIAALRDQDSPVRRAALRSLEGTQDPRAVEPLIAAVRDPETGLDAIRALGATKDPRALETLTGALKDKRVWIREAAANALGELKDARAVDPLVAALNDSINTVAIRSAESLAAIGDSRAVVPLIATLKNDRNVWTRAAVANALGAFRDPRAIGPLIDAMKDLRQFPSALASVAEALNSITGQGFGEDVEKWKQWWEQNRKTFRH